MKNGGGRLDDWHGVVADCEGVGGRDRVQQMGGIGDGRDVMDYRLQFPRVTHFLIFTHDDFFRPVIATAKNCRSDEIRISMGLISRYARLTLSASFIARILLRFLIRIGLW